jgi:hypothetical protein
MSRRESKPWSKAKNSTALPGQLGSPASWASHPNNVNITHNNGLYDKRFFFSFSCSFSLFHHIVHIQVDKPFFGYPPGDGYKRVKPSLQKQIQVPSRPNQSYSRTPEAQDSITSLRLSSADTARAQFPFPLFSSKTALHAQAHAATLLVGSLTLHLLADLDVDIEELGDAAVQADGLALVEVAFAVIGGDTLLCAGLGQAARRGELAIVS